jgi:hypothetical protein
MKQPILRIKKDAIVYDDRAPSRSHPEIRAAWRARLAAEEEHVNRKGPGGRRALFSLLIMAAGLFLVWSLLPRQSSDRATIAGWQVILRAAHSGDALIVGVTFVVASAGPTGTAPTAAIDFTVAGTEIRRPASGVLEKSPMTIRQDIPYASGMKRVGAVVRIGGESATLATAVPAP